MNTLTFFLPSLIKKQSPRLPATARGRALYTTDWFLNGKPVVNNHDNPRLDLKSGLSC